MALKRSKGSTLLEQYRAGKVLTRQRAILAKCADCMGLYSDGLQECHLPSCALYPFSPYRNGENGCAGEDAESDTTADAEVSPDGTVTLDDVDETSGG